MTLVQPVEFACVATVDRAHPVVAVCGELDMSTTPALARSLEAVLDLEPAELTLDLAGVEFMDATGVTVLVRTSKRLKEHEGALMVTHPTPPVRRVLEIVGLDSLLVA